MYVKNHCIPDSGMPYSGITTFNTVFFSRMSSAVACMKTDRSRVVFSWMYSPVMSRINVLVSGHYAAISSKSHLDDLCIVGAFVAIVVAASSL